MNIFVERSNDLYLSVSFTPMHYPFCLSAFSAGAQHLRYQVGFEVVLLSWFSRLPTADCRAPVL